MWVLVSQGMLVEVGVMYVVEGKDYVELLVLFRCGFVDVVIGLDLVMCRVDMVGVISELWFILFDQYCEFYVVVGVVMFDDIVQCICVVYQYFVDSGVVVCLRQCYFDVFYVD